MVVRFIVIFCLIFQSTHTFLFAQTLLNDFEVTIKGKPRVRAMNIQDDGKILIGGRITIAGETLINNLVRFNADGSLDQTFTAPEDFAKDSPYEIIVLDNRILVLQFSNLPSMLMMDGSRDPNFDVSNVITQSSNVLPVGDQLLMTGSAGFDRLFVRINLDGSLDALFDRSSGSSGSITEMLNVENGKVLIASRGAQYQSQDVNGIFRINSDGTLDDSFDAGSGFGDDVLTRTIYDMALTAEGKYLVMGNFNTYNGANVSDIIRINPDGSLDDSFDREAILNKIGLVYRGQLESLSDNRMLITGTNGSGQITSIRLNQDGTIDETYTQTGVGLMGRTGDLILRIGSDNKSYLAGDLIASGTNLILGAMEFDADGNLNHDFNPSLGYGSQIRNVVQNAGDQFLIGGNFYQVNNEDILNVALVNKDGSLDKSFDASSIFSPNDFLLSVAEHPNGQILVSASFSNLGGIENGIARLNPDGTLDDSFQATISGLFGDGVNSFHFDGDQIILGGDFNTVNDQKEIAFARLNLDGTLDQTYTESFEVDSFFSVRTLERIQDGFIAGGATFTVEDGFSGTVNKIQTSATTATASILLEGLDHSINSVENLGDTLYLMAGAFITGYSLDFDVNPLYQFNPVTLNVDNISIRLNSESSFNDFFYQNENNLIIGGWFEKINDLPIAHLARVSLTGDVQRNFDLQLDGKVSSIIPGENDEIYIFGSFTQVAGLKRVGGAKLRVPTANPITSVEPHLDTMISVYPNPMQETLKISWESNFTGELTIDLVDMIGNAIPVANAVKNTSTFNYTAQLTIPEGIYILRIGNRRKTFVQTRILVKK